MTNGQGKSEFTTAAGTGQHTLACRHMTTVTTIANTISFQMDYSVRRAAEGGIRHISEPPDPTEDRL